jgi:hypothetical protein
MGLNELQFNTMEMDAGMLLLDDYIGTQSDKSTLAWSDRFKRRLARNPKYGYWNWFINQKRDFDTRTHAQFRAIFTNIDHSGHVVEEYEMWLTEWLHSDTLHERLRNFINQSTTLFI